MNILIIGNGGREHALAWKAAQSPLAAKVFVAPGNAGTAMEPDIENVDIAATDIPALVEFALQKNINLTIVGPEAPLAAGVVDQFRAVGLKCFGPTQRAAQLESSKAFCKDFLARHRIPTASYRTFSDPEEAIHYIRQNGAPIVVKADGLAAGKGVVVAQTESEAIQAVTDMLSGNVFGQAGSRVVVEEFLHGEEASFIVVADGNYALPMATSQDHKARDNGDKGPNTGGMGAYSPAPVVSPEIHRRVMDEIINPTLLGMIEEGIPYTGFLYAGLMISADGSVKVLEYNCRFGDPETQPIMMRLKSDLIALCLSALEGNLARETITWTVRPALGVVLASAGYPGEYEKGFPISGLTSQKHCDNRKIFHAGTILRDGNVLTDGGRVLCVCALGDTIRDAQAEAYSLAKSINWNGMYYRTDIGFKAINK